MSESNTPKPKLRWYQFSLRTLFVITVFVAIGLGWLEHRIQRIRNEIASVKELQKLKAHVGFYSQKNWNKLSIPDRWLWKWFGDYPVGAVILDETPTTDTDLEHLKRLANLQELDLSGTQITDAGLEHLKGVNSLKKLNLKGSQVSNAGVRKLQKALPNCKISH